ncbi:MAG: 50S ribosomal protein L13 [Candidatus Omnitrophica bacterium CG11_big_fil_rev_8_21_14_0_20_45_26]|uniref:Large ribosomal subunit protein uL13 n=1 Tax=Candidatus Abzuiibacterium crystallinum TaxID=1974748 RepID=A0A2H0LUY8_9BACT|nr:MAG: 50S ribosomal protein L13 [Candidatus Omnitrophica bacterium CG11_big_fil_rev_8_21_14_0_20_45_26]PIW63389.1 MAG: 50S ribosomal protein L13 [Candidatus Omnitrophica bacterium CG12_big_fil_rev_8_21_14_0_65_45_16]
MPNRTFIPKTGDLEKKWYVIDAKGQILGRMATRIATLLMGKHKPTYTPYQDGGDYVIVINAKEVQVSGNKAKDKIYKHYTGYPSGLKQYNYETLMERKPEEIIERAVERMLPKNRLGSKLIKHLHVYAGDAHHQQAQKPVPLTV